LLELHDHIAVSTAQRVVSALGALYVLVVLVGVAEM
jgi:hypothetical protein